MNRSTIIVTFILMSLALVSCESDEVTTPQTNVLERKLLLNPPHLEGEQYIEYTFSAQVSTAQPFVFYWDFDEGDGLELRAGSTVRHTFYQNRVYNVRVKASNDTIAYVDSIRVDIRPPISFANIYPKAVDTVLAMSEDGMILEPLSFSVSSSIPKHLMRTEWYFSDGDVKSGDSTSPEYRFSRVGSYLVRVVVRDTSGAYIGSDTATVTLGFPTIGIADFKGPGEVFVMLTVDTLHPVLKDTLFINPFSVGISGYRVGSTWNFESAAFKITYRSSVIGFPPPVFRDSVYGEFSKDFSIIKTMRVVVDDSSGSAICRYSYNLKDLHLLSITKNKIIYWAKSSNLSDFAGNILYTSTIQNRHRGHGSSFAPPKLEMPPLTFVIFYFN